MDKKPRPIVFPKVAKTAPGGRSSVPPSTALKRAGKTRPESRDTPTKKERQAIDAQKLEPPTDEQVATFIDQQGEFAGIDDLLERAAMFHSIEWARTLLSAIGAASAEAVQTAKSCGIFDAQEFRRACAPGMNALIQEGKLPFLIESDIRELFLLFKWSDADARLTSNIAEIAAVFRRASERRHRKSPP